MFRLQAVNVLLSELYRIKTSVTFVKLVENISISQSYFTYPVVDSVIPFQRIVAISIGIGTKHLIKMFHPCSVPFQRCSLQLLRVCVSPSRPVGLPLSRMVLLHASSIASSQCLVLPSVEYIDKIYTGSRHKKCKCTAAELV